MKVSNHLIKKVKAKENELKEILQKVIPEKDTPEITISFKLDSVRVLGDCYTFIMGGKPISRIRLNPSLLEEYKQSYIDDVFVHEFAHACVGFYYANSSKSIKPHGKEFKSFCRFFGIEGRATSNISYGLHKKSKNRQRRWAYSCGCTDYNITTYKHNKFQKGEISLSCGKCGNVLSRRVV